MAVRPCVTQAVWEEYELRIPDVLSLRRRPVNPHPTLDWLLAVALFAGPALWGKPRGQDLKDDRYLACALGAHANWIVSNDRDLPGLQRPFGIEIITPIQLLTRIAA